MAYVRSTSIKVFPTINRDTENSGDIYSRHISEALLSNIVNRLIDSDGFVITKELDLESTFEFNIHGYYFKVDTAQTILDLFSSISAGDVICAGIKLSNENSWTELSGRDSKELTDTEYKYSGVTFFKLGDEVELDYYIPLINIDSNSEPYIDVENYYKFYGQSVEIDGGDLDN